MCPNIGQFVFFVGSEGRKFVAENLCNTKNQDGGIGISSFFYIPPLFHSLRMVVNFNLRTFFLNYF
jgi:hypothetical protein